MSPEQAVQGNLTAQIVLGHLALELDAETAVASHTSSSGSAQHRSLSHQLHTDVQFPGFTPGVTPFAGATYAHLGFLRQSAWVQGRYAHQAADSRDRCV